MDAFVHFSNQTQGRERLFRKIQLQKTKEVHFSVCVKAALTSSFEELLSCEPPGAKLMLIRKASTSCNSCNPGAVTATQYTCMLLSYVLENKRGREALVMKLKHLESSMSSGRKLFRLGNMVHAIVAARRSNQLPELVPRFCLTVSNLNRALYFVCDMLLWVRSVGLFPNVDKKKWRKRATKCYYYSLVMNLAEDLYELCRCMEQTARAKNAQKDLPPCGQRVQSFFSHLTGGLQPFLLLLYLTLRNHPPLLLDTLKNLCDLSSPLHRLGIYKTNPGVIALCGIISSLVGILTVASPSLRLKH